MNTERTLVYFGDHRCASTWLLTVTNEICNYINVPFSQYHEWLNMTNRRSTNFVVDINADWEHRLEIGRLRGFHVIRDPRDIVVSAYFSHKYSHPSGEWLDKQRNLLQTVELDDGIRASIDFRRNQFQRMLAWNYDDADIYETRYEMLIERPIDIMKDIYMFLGLFPEPLNEKMLETVLDKYRFDKISGGRTRGEEDTHHHYRKGIAGDWRNHFNDANKEYFKELFNDLLIHLGYEKDENW